MKCLLPLNRTFRDILFPFALSCISAFEQLHAQSYYPGGLGNSSLQLWLTTADNTTLLNASGAQATNGSAVAKWVDKSGKGADATQATVSAQPVYVSNQLNGYGAVVFQNTSQYMTGIAGAYQTIVCTRAMLGTDFQYLFSSPANTDFSVRFSQFTTTVHYTGGPSNGNIPNGNDWCFSTGSPPYALWINGTQNLSGSTATHILVDQAQSPTNATYSLSSNFMSRGMSSNDPIYELFVYSTVLSTTERMILENYQAATWGLTSYLPTSGYTVFAPPSVSTYNKHLVGIGYTSSTDNFLSNPQGTANGSTDGLGFSSGTGAADFLNTAGFLMAAHNGQVNSVLSGVTLPGITPTGLSMFNRSWFVHASGGNSSGNVTVNFSFSDYNSGSLPVGAISYGLLYNATNGSFASGTSKIITNSYSTSSSTVGFVVPASKLADGYYTLIWSSSGMVTLPILLDYFNVSRNQGSVELGWGSRQELNFNYFEVQRAADSATFTPIGTVKANGNSTAQVTYQFTDGLPFPGQNSYRLKMVDLDGNSTYSGVRVIFFDGGKAQDFKIYPNPVQQYLGIGSSSIKGRVGIRLFNTSGQTVLSKNVDLNGTLHIPVGGLANGLYYVQVIDPSTQEVLTVKKFIKR